MSEKINKFKNYDEAECFFIDQYRKIQRMKDSQEVSWENSQDKGKDQDRSVPALEVEF